MLEVLGLDSKFDYVKITTQMGRTQIIDFCNDWAQIGCKIIEHKIQLTPIDGYWRAVVVEDYDVIAGPIYDLETLSEDPELKRAAAICLLMLLDKGE